MTDHDSEEKAEALVGGDALEGEFLLTSVYDDGSEDEPSFHRLDELDPDWQLGRRGFLGSVAVGLGALAGCATPGSKPKVLHRNARQARAARSNERHARQLLGFRGQPLALRFASDDKLAVLCLERRKGFAIRTYSLASGEVLERTVIDERKASAAGCWVREGKELLVLGSEVKHYSLAKAEPQLLHILESHKGSLLCARDSVVLKSFGTRAKAISLSTGKDLWVQNDLSRYHAPALSPDGKIVATVNWHSKIDLYDGQSGKKTKTFYPKDDDHVLLTHVMQLQRLQRRGRVSALAFSPDGKRLAVYRGKRVELWSLPELKLERELKAPPRFRSGGKIAFDSSGQTLVSYEAGRGGELRLWRLADGALLAQQRQESAIKAIAVAPRGEAIAIADDRLQLRVIPFGKEAKRLEAARYLVDLEAQPKGEKLRRYRVHGDSRLLAALPKNPLPKGAVCACDLVGGSGPELQRGGRYRGSRRSTYRGGRGRGSSSRYRGGRGRGSYCSCNRVCVCAPT